MRCAATHDRRGHVGWIDYFNDRPTAAVRRLDSLLSSELVLIGDLILAEVLQGFDQNTTFAARWPF